MEGRARAAKRRFDENVALAWHMAVFSVRADNGKLEQLSKYLEGPSKPQTPDEMLEILQSMATRTDGITIEKMN